MRPLDSMCAIVFDVVENKVNMVKRKLDEFLRNEGSDFVNKTVNYHDDVGETTLIYWATVYKHAEMVKLLIEYGADVNIKDNNGKTPLHWATSKNLTEIAKLLVEHGAKFDV